MSSDRPSLNFTVPLIPTAKGRPQFVKIGKFTRAITPAKTRRAERDFIAVALDHAPPAPLDGPLEVRLVFSLPVPSSAAKWWKAAAAAGAIHHTSRPDGDNLGKLVLDALGSSGQFWRDDAQIPRLVIEKQYAEKPGTEVTITELRDVTAAEWKARHPKTMAITRGAGADQVCRGC